MKFVFPDGKVIAADDFESFVVRLRKRSWFPERTVHDYMRAVAGRYGKFGYRVQYTTTDAFVESLLGQHLLEIVHLGDA